MPKPNVMTSLDLQKFVEFNCPLVWCGLIGPIWLLMLLGCLWRARRDRVRRQNFIATYHTFMVKTAAPASSYSSLYIPNGALVVLPGAEQWRIEDCRLRDDSCGPTSPPQPPTPPQSGPCGIPQAYWLMQQVGSQWAADRAERPHIWACERPTKVVTSH